MQSVPEVKVLEGHSMDPRPTKGHYTEAQSAPMSNDSKTNKQIKNLKETKPRLKRHLPGPFHQNPLFYKRFHTQMGNETLKQAASQCRLRNLLEGEKPPNKCPHLDYFAEAYPRDPCLRNFQATPSS